MVVAPPARWAGNPPIERKGILPDSRLGARGAPSTDISLAWQCTCFDLEAMHICVRSPTSMTKLILFVALLASLAFPTSSLRADSDDSGFFGISLGGGGASSAPDTSVKLEPLPSEVAAVQERFREELEILKSPILELSGNYGDHLVELQQKYESLRDARSLDQIQTEIEANESNEVGLAVSSVPELTEARRIFHIELDKRKRTFREGADQLSKTYLGYLSETEKKFAAANQNREVEAIAGEYRRVELLFSEPEEIAFLEDAATGEEPSTIMTEAEGLGLAGSKWTGRSPLARGRRLRVAFDEKDVQWKVGQTVTFPYRKEGDHFVADFVKGEVSFRLVGADLEVSFEWSEETAVLRKVED